MSAFTHALGRYVGVEHLATRHALRLAGTEQNHALYILPSTARAFRFADDFSKDRVCYVVSGPLVAQRNWNANVTLMTPGSIVQAFRSAGAMNVPVICFPDQLIGAGGSFIEIPFMDEERTFSILEATIVLRYRPTVFGFVTSGPLGCCQLRRIPYGRYKATEAVELQRQLLSLLERELLSNPPDWLGERYFRLKTKMAYDTCLREELKDVLALLLLELARSPGSKSLLAAAETAGAAVRRMSTVV